MCESGSFAGFDRRGFLAAGGAWGAAALSSLQAPPAEHAAPPVPSPIDWRTRKVIAFESDDWGGPDRFGFPDLATYQLSLEDPHTARARNRSQLWQLTFDSQNTLESVADMDALLKLLLRFRGSDGRPPAFTPIYFLANPDFDAIRASGFSSYVDRGIDQPYPEIWRSRGDVIAKAREGMRLGVWFPESHNTRAAGHFDPHQWVKFLHDKRDLALNRFFDMNMIGKPSDPAIDVGKEFDSMGPDQMEEWIRTGTQYFRDAFGYRPHVSGTSDARTRSAALGDLMERLLAKNGVTTIVNATHKRMGQYNPDHGLTYIQRNANLESAMPRMAQAPSGAWLLADNQEPWSDSCYRDIVNAWSNNQPAIVNTHRVNYSTLDAERRTESLRQLERLLKTIQKEHPEAVYRTSHEIGQLYRGQLAA